MAGPNGGSCVLKHTAAAVCKSIAQAKMTPPRVRTIGKLLYGNLPPHCLVDDQSQFNTSAESADNPAEMDSCERT